jgi:hypothetical protein
MRGGASQKCSPATRPHRSEERRTAPTSVNTFSTVLEIADAERVKRYWYQHPAALRAAVTSNGAVKLCRQINSEAVWPFIKNRTMGSRTAYSRRAARRERPLTRRTAPR